jgi:hypothetical protein
MGCMLCSLLKAEEPLGDKNRVTSKVRKGPV